jgi:hypothetical protein
LATARFGLGGEAGWWENWRMALTGKQRLKAFLAGMGGGVVLAGLLAWHHGLPKAKPIPEAGELRREVPGILAQWTSAGQPIEGTFVLSQMLQERAAHGTRTRAVVVPGLDDGSYIRVEETWGPENPPRVRAWKFMFADRVRIKLKAGADSTGLTKALVAQGWMLVRRDPANGWITIGLNAHEAKTVGEALAQVRAWPQVDAAEPDELPGPQASGG